MNPADRIEFAKVLMGFAELKGKALSKAAVDLYWSTMQDWDIADFKAAAEHLLRTCEFMPVPKDFEDLRKAGRPTAGEAWAKALRHASSSAYRNGPLGDETIDAAVRAIGGYVVIAMCDEDKTHFLERRFCELFESIQDADDTREAVPQIAFTNDAKRLSGPQSIKQLLGRDAA